MHYVLFRFATCNQDESNSQDLAEQDDTKCNDNCCKIYSRIGKDYEISDIACLEYQGVAHATCLQKFYHTGDLIEVCHLQTRAVDESFGNGKGNGKDIALAHLNVNETEIVCADGIERAKKLGSLFDCNRAVRGNLALCNSVCNSAAQCVDILNGAELNAAAKV